jgi:ABC-2 type transport system ATP-binding protein
LISQTSPLLVISHLRKTFGDKVAVEDVSFEVFSGEVFGLLGPNGAGKTTTIRMILDIFKPDAGEIAVLGGPMNPPRADRTGYMPEERGLYPDMRVLDCLVYLGTLKGMSRKEAKQRAMAYLERLDLAEQHRNKIQTLSRGMTQKVQVIAAILHQPDLIIIDEPFANLDPVNAQLVRDIILELRDRGAGIIMTSHQLGLVESLCDRIALIHKGKVVLHGQVREIRRQFAANVLYVSGSGELNGNLPGVLFVERRSATDWLLTLDRDVHPQAVLQSLTSIEGFSVDRFEVALPTLDEIFIQVVKEKG